MKSRKNKNMARQGAVALLFIGCLTGATAALAQTMDQYTAMPPFVSNQVAPNILLVMDNSLSMANRACEVSSCGVLPDGSTSTVTTFTNTTRYSGIFDPLLCYVYDSGADNRFEPATAKASVGTACMAAGEWDGNFLNWAVMRRFDAVKKAMMGGDCAIARAADGTCPPFGTPALKTVRGQIKFENSSDGHETVSISYNAGAGVNTYVGRIPVSATPGTPNTVYVHLRGGNSGMGGIFCLDNDNSPPAAANTPCPDADGFNESTIYVRVGMVLEPKGVIQEVGPQGRFGLAVFNDSGTLDGIKVLTGIGSRQSVDFALSAVETFNTNTAAMVDSIEETYPASWTPLSESLYDSARYVAQINSAYYPTQYVYPIAYSNAGSSGSPFQSTGTGAWGNTEISALTGVETCPAGYIASACGRDPFFYGSNHTPAWASNSTQVQCCKTFILIFTDGEPTADQNISPVSLRTYANANAQPYAGTYCAGNRGVPYVDPPGGTCNNDPATPNNVLLKQHRTDYANNGTHYLDDVAYWAHVNDLRPCNGTADGTIAVLNVAGHCLPGMQNAIVYTFYAFGNLGGRELLMHTALLGGFEDLNNDSLPDSTMEWDTVVNATGAPGSDGIPDTYFESSNVEDLQERLTATFTSILRRSASGTSISVLATSSTGEGTVYQAYFFTNDVGQGGANVKWVGYTHALFVDAFGNFREDTIQDGVQNYAQDLIITTRYDNTLGSPTYQRVLVDKFNDLNGDGVADSATPVFTGELNSIRPIWEAGKELALTNWNSRNVLTWVDQDNDGLVDPGEEMNFSTANCMALREYLRYAGDTCAGGSNATNLIEFILGREVPGLRTRMLEVPIGSGSYNVWKLGDPIHSTPTVVAAPRSRYDLQYGDGTYTDFYQQYRTRRQVVYVGANDGMLHAFNGGFYHKGDDPTTPGTVEHGWYTKNPTDNSSGANLGAELWSFVPYQLLPQLQWLAQTNYTHVYYVDLKPTIAEARIFTPDADHPGGWGTVLIGGFRMGGSCGSCIAGGGAPPMTVTIGGVPRTFYSAYFVLDITNPEVAPKLLWSFGSAGLGLTTSYPAVARMNPTTDASIDPTNEKWYVIFGSGPNGYNADLPTPPLPTSPQTAKLYVVDLKAGPGVGFVNVTRMPIGSWNSFMGHVVAVDKNLDWRTDVAYAGRTIHDGALPWRGKMYRLKMSCSVSPCSPTTWGIPNGADRTPTEMIDTFFDAPSGTTLEVGPVASAPSVTIDDANLVWVFFGTGRYFANVDKVDNSIQRLYGIKDSVVNGTCTELSTFNCWDDDLVDATNAVICVICSGATNQVTDPTNPGVTTFDGTGATSMVGLVQSKDGWRVTLPGPATIGGINYGAERSVVNPTLIAGTIFFPTFTPTNDFCSADGQSYLYALFYKTGTASTAPVIGTSVSGLNTNVTTKVSLGVGLASSGTMHLGEGGTLNFQQSTGAFSQTQASLKDYYSRFVSWVHQRD
jgi:type IV pilus assembly protein PilY1